MVRSGVPRRGDVYWIDPNPVAGREMQDRHRFVVITPQAINALGVSMTVRSRPEAHSRAASALPSR